MNSAMNFYDEMCRIFKEKSGFEVYEDSDVGIRFSAVSAAMSNLLKKAEESIMAQSIENCSSEMLDLYAKEYGITRKPGTPAKVSLMLRTGDAFLDADVIIPQGTLVGDKYGNIFATDSMISLGKSSKSALVNATALKPGKLSIGAQTLTCFCSTVSPVVTVTNTKSVVSGENAETDENLKYRLRQLHNKFPCGINKEGIKAICLQHPNIKDAYVTYDNDAVNIYIDVYDESIYDFDSYSEYLLDNLPLFVNFIITLCNKKVIDLSIDVKQPVLSEYDNIVRQKVNEYFDKLKIGETINYAELYNSLNEINFCENFMISQLDSLNKLKIGEKYTLGNLNISEV